MRYRAQCVVASTIDDEEGPTFEDVWVDGPDTDEIYKRVEAEHPDLQVIDVFTEDGRRIDAR